MMKKITILCRRLLDWLRNGFVFSKTIFFIWGLVFGYALVKKAVVDVLFEILQEDHGLSEWKATFLTIMLDLISAVFTLGVTHVSDDYTGRFTVIIFCTGAYAMGLMMLNTDSGLGQLIFSVVLIGLGTAGQEPTFQDYFDNQLSEEVNKKYATDDSRRRKSHNLWWPTASFAGSVVAVFKLGGTSSSTRLQFSSYFMAATYLLFFLGVFSYYTEEIPSGSPQTTIYTIIRAAINKRRLPYPSSEEGYYSNRNNISTDSFYDRSENGEIHLLPRGPSCLSFLDKAAIIGRNVSDDEREEERNREACTVEQVRAVKSLYPIIPLGYMLFGYSLVSAAGNTYFIQQAYNLNPNVGDFQVSIVAFFVLKSLFAHGVRTVQSMKQLVKPIRSIAVGMFCSGLCGISAWLVERRSLTSLKEEISLSIMVLTPQFILLGLMEAFAEDGLVSLVCLQLHMPESMTKLVAPFSQLLLAIEKNFGLLFAYCFGVLTNESEDTSLLDWYFLFLALLSFGLFGICLCSNSFTRPPYEETQIDDEGSNN